MPSVDLPLPLSAHPHREPIVRFYGIGPEVLFDFDWNTYPIPPPLSLWQLYIGPELDSSMEDALNRDIGALLADRSVEGVSIVSYSMEWTHYALKRLRPSAIKYVEIRIRPPAGHYEHSVVYDHRGITSGAPITGTFMAPTVDQIEDSMLKKTSSTPDAMGPCVLHILPLPSRRFLGVTNGIASKAVDLLRLKCPQMRKCVLTLDIFSHVEQVFDVLNGSPCDDIEFLEPTIFQFAKLATGMRLDLTNKFIRGLMRVTHVRVLVLPLVLMTDKLLACVAYLPKLEVLRIRPGELECSSPAAFFCQVAARSENHILAGFRKLNILDIGVHEAEDIDHDNLPKIYDLFPKAMVYQSTVNKGVTDSLELDEELLQESIECFKEWGWEN